MAPHDNYGEKRGRSLGVIFKRVNLMSAIRAPPGLRRGHKMIPLHDERCARRAWDVAKNVYNLTHTDTATFYSPVEANAGAHSKMTRGQRIRR